MTGPLQGLKVLDLTAMLAGPYATMLLADLGADVVKIEPPTGDLTRRIGPFRPEAGEGRLGGYFQSVNRGKRSVVLDLKAAADVETLNRLCETADILIQNLRPGVVDEIGIGPEAMLTRHPRLIFAFYSLRNPNYKPRAILRRTDVDTSIMAFDNPLDDRKPEAASLTACGKHWIEDTGELLFVNSRSRISDLNNKVASCDPPRKAHRPIHGGLA